MATETTQLIRPIDYAKDVDNGTFDFSHYGKNVFRPKKQWSERPQTDLIHFDALTDMAELDT